MFNFTKPITKVEKAIMPLMEWKNGELYSRQSKPNGSGFEKTNVAITDWFGMDLWRLQSGWFWWIGTGKDARRHTVLVPFGQPQPNKPADDATECYSVPVYSQQLGPVGADFVIENAGAFLGIQALLEHINGCDELKQGMVPHVQHMDTLDTDDGPVPVLDVVKWGARPDRWGVRLLNVPA
jgi:hypothetical protein